MPETCRALRIRESVPELVLAIKSGLTEIALVDMLLTDRISAATAVVLHIVVVAGIAVWTWVCWRKGRDLRAAFLLLAFVAVLGPLGSPAAVTTLVMTARYSSTARPFEEWYNALFPAEAESDDFAARIRQQALGENDSITPLIDVLTFGRHAQKQALLTLVAGNFRPAFAPVLKMALNDSNNAIRVQAATAITKIENDFMSKVVELTERAEASPHDPDTLRAIAGHYDNYAFIGLLDHDRERECRENALAFYRRSLVAAPSDAPARLAVGRILVRENRHVEAAAWFRDEKSPVPESREQTIWHMESLFHTGRLEELRALVARSKGNDSADFPVEVQEVMKLWSAS